MCYLCTRKENKFLRNSVCLIKMLKYFSSTTAMPGIKFCLKDDPPRGILPADQVKALSPEKRRVRDGRDGGGSLRGPEPHCRSEPGATAPRPGPSRRDRRRALPGAAINRAAEERGRTRTNTPGHSGHGYGRETRTTRIQIGSGSTETNSEPEPGLRGCRERKRLIYICRCVQAPVSLNRWPDRSRRKEEAIQEHSELNGTGCGAPTGSHGVRTRQSGDECGPDTQGARGPGTHFKQHFQHFPLKRSLKKVLSNFRREARVLSLPECPQ